VRRRPNENEALLGEAMRRAAAQDAELYPALAQVDRDWCGVVLARCSMSAGNAISERRSRMDIKAG
jgi:hypothetical protein